MNLLIPILFVGAVSSTDVVQSLQDFVGVDPDYLDMVAALSEQPRIGPTDVSADFLVGQALHFEQMKNIVWHMALHGYAIGKMLEEFRKRNVGLNSDILMKIRQMSALRIIDADYFDLFLSEVPSRVPNYASLSIKKIVAFMFFHPLSKGRNHLTLFFKMCVDLKSLTNSCKRTTMIEMNFGDPLRVYVMELSAYVRMLNTVGRLLIDKTIDTIPMH